jgi:hypothetical protein
VKEVDLERVAELVGLSTLALLLAVLLALLLALLRALPGARRRVGWSESPRRVPMPAD